MWFNVTKWLTSVWAQHYFFSFFKRTWFSNRTDTFQVDKQIPVRLLLLLPYIAVVFSRGLTCENGNEKPCASASIYALKFNFVTAILGGVTQLTEKEHISLHIKYTFKYTVRVAGLGLKCRMGNVRWDATADTSSLIYISLFHIFFLYFRRREVIIASIAHSKYGSTQRWRLHLLSKQWRRPTGIQSSSPSRSL